MKAATVGVVLLVLLSGCAGLTDGGGTQPTAGTSTTVGSPTDQTRTATVTATPTPTPPEGAAQDDIVAFSDLTSTQQNAFLSATNRTVTFAPESPAINNSQGYSLDAVTPFQGNEYVRYEGAYYRLTLRLGQTYMSYRIEADAESAGENATVHEYGDLPSDLQTAVQNAIVGRSYWTPYGMSGDSPPRPLRDGDYVRYENATYLITFTGVADSPSHRLTVEPAE